MSVVMWYGGYILAGLSFLMAVFLLFYNKIPSVIKYLAGTKRRPAANKAYAGTGKVTGRPGAQKTKTQKKPQIAPTEIIDITAEGTSVEKAETTILKDNPNRVIQGITEVLDATEVLPRL